MNKIEVKVLVNSGLEKVWKFWNTPEYIQLWAFASSDWECPYAENNLVVGGKFVTRMSAKNKSFSFDFAGTYTEVKEKEKIAYVMSDDVTDISARTCEVFFKEVGNGMVEVVETFDAENQNSLEMQKNGWQSILNNFKTAVESTEK